LAGTWLLINGQYYTADRDSLIGEVNNAQQPAQIKVFSNGYFAYLNRGENGLNTAWRAGPYRIEGSTTIETHDWSSYKIVIGATTTYEFRIVEDTLFVSGPVTSVFSDGKDWDDHIQMDEIRIRAK